MPTDEEMRAYYEKQKEADRKKYGDAGPPGGGLSSTFEEFMGKKGHRQAPRESRPRMSQREAVRTWRDVDRDVRAHPASQKRSLGASILGGAKNWLENAGANVQGREPPHKAKSGAAKWFANASANINSGRVNTGFNPFGGFSIPSNPAPMPPGWGLNFGPGPAEPAPRRSGKKKKKHRRKSSEPAKGNPWDMNYIPPGVRRFM